MKTKPKDIIPINAFFVILNEVKPYLTAGRNLKILMVLVLGVLFQPFDLLAQRFPKPEFESGYIQAETQIPVPRSDFLEYLDILVLILTLSVITWFVLKKRSRIGVFWTSLFSILYFGFYREGCVCSVGSIQNIALALFNNGYNIPFTAIAFFVIPLIFTLFFGRTFCAGVCPLGAIQDLFIWKPMKLSSWAQKMLGLIPFIYLGLAVLYAATGTDFVICRYDPFVGIYRLDAEFSMFVLGGAFLATSIVIARPYCRFFCPYGVLLNWFSRISKHHMTITPTKCIQCKLCEDSCPFGAIDIPDEIKLKESKKVTTRRFVTLTLIIPLLVFLGVVTGLKFHTNLAMVNNEVSLASEVLYLENNPEITTQPNYEETIEIEAFRSSGQPVAQLYAKANSIIEEFRIGSMWLGAFIGLAFGLTLANLSVFRYRKDFEPNKATCLSCARCMDYCPVDDESKIIEKI